MEGYHQIGLSGNGNDRVYFLQCEALYSQDRISQIMQWFKNDNLRSGSGG